MKNGMLSLLSIFIFIVCCSSNLTGQEVLKKEYYKTLSQVQKGKATPKKIESLQLVLERLISSRSARKAILVKRGDLVSIEEALQINLEIQEYMKDATGHLTEDYNEHLISLTAEERSLKNDCAKGYFTKGESKFITAQTSNDKLQGREAFESFQKAATYEYVDQDKLVELLLSSFEFAQVIYGLDPDDYDPLFSGWIESNNQFVKIVPLNQSEKSSCDCIISLDYEAPVISDNNSIKPVTYTKRVEDGYDTKEVVVYHTNSQGEPEAITTEQRVPKFKNVTVTERREEKNRICQARAHLTVQARTKNCLLENKTLFEEVEDSLIEGGRIPGHIGMLPSDNLPDGDLKTMDTEYEMEDKVLAKLKMKVYQAIVPEQ